MFSKFLFKKFGTYLDLFINTKTFDLSFWEVDDVKNTLKTQINVVRDVSLKIIKICHLEKKYIKNKS